jgi:hypothetical protein
MPIYNSYPVWLKPSSQPFSEANRAYTSPKGELSQKLEIFSPAADLSTFCANLLFAFAVAARLNLSFGRGDLPFAFSEKSDPTSVYLEETWKGVKKGCMRAGLFSCTPSLRFHWLANWLTMRSTSLAKETWICRQIRG